jgi:hypothetical protein
MGLRLFARRRAQAAPPAEEGWQPGVTCRLCGRSIAHSALSGLWWAAGDLADDAADCPHEPGGDVTAVAVAACGSYEMDDDYSRAGDEAWGVTFTLASAPGATITIWAYATYGPSDVPGSFHIGYRAEYAHPGAGHVPGTDVSYDYDPEFFFDLGECETACRDVAQIMTLPRLGPPDGPAADWELLLDWDGVPT